jgi:hypothetical protein
MTKVDLESKVENLIAKKEELLKNKEIFKVNIERIFSDFKNDSFIPYFDQLKSKINEIFNDYIINAKAKLKKSNEDVETTLNNLKDEIDQTTKNSENSLKVKYEDLKTKINLEKQKIQGLMIINNNNFKEFKFENCVEKDKKMKMDEFAKPLALTFFSISSIGGIIFGIVQGIGFVDTLMCSIAGGFTLGGIGAVAGGLAGLVGFGGYKIYKAFHKKEDVIEISKKAQTNFLIEFEKHYSKAKNTFDEDKKKIIDNVCNGIDVFILKMDNTINEMGKN